jgi:hypothetical protein
LPPPNELTRDVVDAVGDIIRFGVAGGLISELAVAEAIASLRRLPLLPRRNEGAATTARFSLRARSELAEFERAARLGLPRPSKSLLKSLSVGCLLIGVLASGG